MIYRLLVFSVGVFLLASGCRTANRFVLPPDLEEVSGLYYAASDSLWWHNDSGDSPVLYLTDGRGNLTKRWELPTLRHKDWEDISYDDKGHIFVGDVGNNSQKRKDQTIYKLHPETGRIDSIPFRYSDRTSIPDAYKSYDLEGFFWYKDSLHLFTKDRLPSSPFTTRHYVLSDSPSGIRHTAWLRDSLVLPKRVVTGAAIHASSGTVGLVSYYYKRIAGFIPYSAATVFLFDQYDGQSFLQGRQRKKRISFLLSTQYESIDFSDENHFWVASEKTVFIRPKAKRKKWRSSKPSPVGFSN